MFHDNFIRKIFRLKLENWYRNIFKYNAIHYERFLEKDEIQTFNVSSFHLDFCSIFREMNSIFVTEVFTEVFYMQAT